MINYHPDDDYFEWLDCNACPQCAGEGEGWDDGVYWQCATCLGDGVDPNAEYQPNE